MPRRRQSDRQAGAREAPEHGAGPTAPHASRRPRPRTSAWRRRSAKPSSSTNCSSHSRTPRTPSAIMWRGRGGIPVRPCSAACGDWTPGVQPFSQCRVSGRDGVVDRTTGARGVILQVARVTWPHATAADVVGGYYLTHRQAASFRYHLELHDSRWAVTAAHLLWRV